LGLLLLIILIAEIQSFAQPGFLRRCPYDVNAWPYPLSNTLTCPAAFRPIGLGTSTPCPSGYRIKPQQDCCGALPICDRIVTVYSVGDPRGNLSGFSASICGVGCVPEWPQVGTNSSNGESCFMYNREQQVSYYIFEVKPLPNGGSEDQGAYAGYLRFRIFPCDVPTNNALCDEGGSSESCNCDTISPYNFCNDNGISSIGNTDFDWLLWDITNFPTRRSACNAISTDFSNPNHAPIVSANWAGYTGPTGMFDPGTSSCPAAGNTARYSRLLRVSVGQRFILGINCFTGGNIKGYKLDFGGACQESNVLLPTANITSIPSGTAIDTVALDTNYCGVGSFDFSLTNELAIDSITQPRKFKVTSLSNRSSTHEVTDVMNANSEAIAYSKKYSLRFTPATPGRYKLKYVDTLRSVCGNRFISDSTYFTISKYLLAQKEDDSIHCAEYNKPIKLKAKLNPNRGFAPIDRPERVVKYKWKLLYYASRGNLRGDSLYPGFKLGTITVNGVGTFTTGSPAQVRRSWDTTSNISIIDNSNEKDGATGLRIYGIRCICVFPVGNGDNILETGCTDSVDFEAVFKPLPFANVTRGDSDCVNSDPAKLVLTTPDNKRIVTWFEVADESSFTPLSTVSSSSTFTSTYKQGTTNYYRASVTDTSFGTVCTSIWPPLDSSASRIDHAIQVVPRFRWIVLGNGLQKFPATLRFYNNSYILDGTDTLPLPATGIIYLWNFGAGKAPLATSNATSSIDVLYDSIPNTSDSLNFSVSLSAFDDIAKGIGIEACLPNKTVSVVLRKPEFPNIITPNSELNRTLILKAKNNGLKLAIFNRWGNLVYSSNTYDDSWSGSDVPAGVYYYLATDLESNETYKGWVQILK